MKLYIQIKNGQPSEHPILEENFLSAFPEIDPNNLTSDFAVFERVEQPVIGLYEVYEGSTYEWVSGVVKDVHNVRPMTPQEKTTKQNEIKELWAEKGFASWIFNEETCAFDPPIAHPGDGKLYRWDEETTSWLEVTP